MTARRVPGAAAEGISPVLLMRRDCALCDQLKFALDLMAARQPLGYQQIDIDSDPGLAERYGEQVPVLLVGEQVVCAGHFDIESLEQRLDEALRNQQR